MIKYSPPTPGAAGVVSTDVDALDVRVYVYSNGTMVEWPELDEDDGNMTHTDAAELRELSELFATAAEKIEERDHATA